MKASLTFLLGLLTIVFIVLKLTDVIDWNWFFVLLPVLLIVIIPVIVFLFIFIAGLTAFLTRKNRENEKNI